MIRKCESMLGTRGRPNTATRWYAARNGAYFATAPWCNMFITWAAYHSSNYAEVCFNTDYAYTVWHAQRFQRAGRWHTDTAGIERGDIVFFDWGGTNSVAHIDHVGIVTDVKGSQVFTIEGNTDDRCARRVRYADTIVGYGRPDYDGEPVPAPVPGERVRHTVVPGDSLWAIARRYGVTVNQIRYWNSLVSDIIHPGDELWVSAGAATPAPEPEPAPETPPGYSPPPFPEGLAPGRATPSAKPLQRALKAAGYMPWWVWLSDNYGPATEDAVAKFYRAHPELSTSAYDTRIGPRGWDALHREAYGN